VSDDDQPTTQELRLEQIRREREEAARADTEPTDEGVRTAERRADKAHYLAEKLSEQAAADADVKR